MVDTEADPLAQAFGRQFICHTQVLPVWAGQPFLADVLADLTDAWIIGRELEWISTENATNVEQKLQATGHIDLATDLPIDLHSPHLLRPIQKRKLVRGVASQFLSAVRQVENGRDLELHEGLESLLRNVEVRRQDCLPPQEVKQDKETTCLDRHRVSLIFLIATEKTADLRYLNAALKLNDWAAPTHRRMKPCRCTAKWLHAVARQERFMNELCP